MMLRVENLDVFHGDAQALDGVSLEIDEGRDRRHRRGERRRQDLAHPHHRRHAPPGARAASGSAAPTSAAGTATGSAISVSARWRKAGRFFRRSSVAGEPRRGRHAAARPRRPREKPRAGVRAVSGAGRARGPGGGHALRRRAADAGDRPLPDGRARARHVRRAVARPGAGDRAAAAAHHPRPQPRRAHLRAGRAERGGIAQARAPAPMCWRTDGSRSPARARSCWPTTGCGRPISECKSDDAAQAACVPPAADARSRPPA